MINRIRSVLAIAVYMSLLAYPQISLADTFTGAQFFEWPTKSQRSYFRTSIGMMGVIAAQRQAGQAKCLSDWYFGAPEARHDQMREAMRTHSSFHPQAVILTVLQKACGELG